jgi:polysaccharide biosynthesis/export protein
MRLFKQFLLGQLRSKSVRRLSQAQGLIVCCGFVAFANAQAPETTQSAPNPVSAPSTRAAIPAPSATSAATPVPIITQDYRIGIHDLLELQVFGVDQLNRTVRVNANGNISLPLVGIVEVSGKTAQQAEVLIQKRLAETYLQNPHVSLYIKEFTSQRVTVEGAVKKPGIYPIAGQTTLLRAIALAGGQDQLSDMNEVMIFRLNSESGQRQVAKFDVEKVRRGQQEDPLVLNDDVVVINRSQSRVNLRDSVFRDVIDMFNPFKRF